MRNLKYRNRCAFTLIELLVVMAVAAMLSAMTLTAMYSAKQAASESRTRGIISKVNEQLLMQWSEIESRRLAYLVDPNFSAAQQRLFYQRQLMRIEFPDRKSDLLRPFAPAQRTSRYRGYLRALARVYGLNESTTEDQIISQLIIDPNSPWTPQLQHSECLYMILASTRIDDGNALDYFGDAEIGDTDNDGMKEILDGWGNPIFFLRWAPGHVAEVGIPDATQTAAQTVQGAVSPDGFDPLHADVMWNTSDNLDHFFAPYQLYPLVVSAGRDKAFDIVFDFDMAVDSAGNFGTPVVYANERGDPNSGLTANNPYAMRCVSKISDSVPDDDCGMSTTNSVVQNLSQIFMIGMPADTDGSSFSSGPDNFDDNISNQQSLVQ